MSREAHQCHRDGCDTMARFDVLVHVQCPQSKMIAHQTHSAHSGIHNLSFRSTIKVCHRHREEVRDWVISPMNREIIRASLASAHYPEPNFESVRIEFVPIKDDGVVISTPRARCDRSECRAPAKFQVKQVFPNIGDRKGTPAVEVLTNLCVCEGCAPQVKADDFADQESRDTIRVALNSRGAVLADIDRMEIGLVPITRGRMVDPENFGEPLKQSAGS